MENNMLDTQFLHIIKRRNTRDITSKPHIGYGGTINPSCLTGYNLITKVGNGSRHTLLSI